MSQLVKDATANFAKFAPALAAAVEENITPLLEAGLVELLVSKLNSGTGGRAGADVIDNVISSPEIQPWDYPGLLKATVDRILKLISTKKKDDEYDALMRILSNLIWRYDGKEEDSMRGALAEAGFHNVCMVLIKEGDYDSSRMYSILINLSNTKQCAVPMVRDNCHTFIMDRMKAAPKNVWTDDLHGTDGGNAFDVATNLAKWASIRSDLIKAGYVEILAELVQYENYFGFESTEGLAYIVGRSEDAKNTKLLQAKERNVRLLFEVLEGSLNGNPVRFNITWSVYGRVLAIQSLSVSDGNKELLRPAIPLLNRVLKECSDDEDSVELALQCLLEMGLYFNEKNDTVIKDLPDILNTLAGYASSSNTKIAQYASNLKFALTPKPVATATAASSGAAGDGWVMISYNWKSQPIVKVLNQKLKDAGIKTWIDIEQMNGDTVEKMAEAVEGAKAVIICITENYKESAPCRLEANYAFKNRKPIVPILMQEGYVPTGWLGLLIGNQLYYPIASEEAVAPIVPNILNDIAKQTGLASAADAAKKAASAVPSHSSVATSSSPSKSAGASASAASSSGPAVGGYVGASFPSDKVLNMTPEDIEKHFTSKGQQKLGAYLKKQQITGKSLAIVFDMYSRGDGSVIAICKDLGAKSTAHALEVLFIIRELCVESGAASFGPRFPSELLQKMNEIQVEQWLFSKGLPKLGTYFKKSGLKGSGLAILFDLYNRSDATLIKICHDLGTSSTVQSLQLLSLLKDISNLDQDFFQAILFSRQVQVVLNL